MKCKNPVWWLKSKFCEHEWVSVSEGCLDPTENKYCPKCKTLMSDEWEYYHYTSEHIKNELYPELEIKCIIKEKRH